MSREEDQPENNAASQKKASQGDAAEKFGRDTPESAVQIEAVGKVMRKYRDTLRRLADS